jgi:nitroreductase
MDLFEALYTTRAMRRVKTDPIPQDVQAKLLDAAIRAPSGGNMQNWRFMLVDEPAVRTALAPVYRECLQQLWETIYKQQLETSRADPDTPENAQFLRIHRSAQHLADHFEEYPLLLFTFVQFDPSGGSIFPATWSAMLAARQFGVGATLTTVFILRVAEVLKILDVPTEQGWLFSSCVCFGYPTGRWGVAARRPVHEVSFRNRWGTPVGFDVAQPLWP